MPFTGCVSCVLDLWERQLTVPACDANAHGDCFCAMKQGMETQGWAVQGNKGIEKARLWKGQGNAGYGAVSFVTCSAFLFGCTIAADLHF